MNLRSDTTVAFNGTVLTVTLSEAWALEEREPWFRIVFRGERWLGQAVEPPERLKDGKLRYRVTMRRDVGEP